MNKVNVRSVGAFLILTFALLWSVDFTISEFSNENEATRLVLPPLGMLFPAFVAIMLQLFVDKDSALYFRSYRDQPRWVFFSYLALTLLVGFITILSLLLVNSFPWLPSLANIAFILWTLLVIRLYRQCGEERFRAAGLQLGDTAQGVKLVVYVVIFLLLQSAMNLVFGLGKFTGISENIQGIPIPNSLYPLGLIAFFVLAVIGSPLGKLAILFGEEYAWRGYLGGDLMKLGSRRGAFLVGIVWGLFHFPIILSGVHTYPPNPMGLSLGMVFFVLWGFFQSYSVLKTGSVWTAVFLHGVVNGVYAFSLQYLVRPVDKVFSFGLGIYGLASLAIVVAIILRDPIWDKKGVFET